MLMYACLVSGEGRGIEINAKARSKTQSGSDLNPESLGDESRLLHFEST